MSRPKRTKEIPVIKREPGYFSLLIIKDGTRIFEKHKLNKEDFYKIYFRNLKENIEKHPDYTVDKLLESYKTLWSKFEIHSKYIDSYGHLWDNTMPSDNMMKNYLNKIKYEITKK